MNPLFEIIYKMANGYSQRYPGNDDFLAMTSLVEITRNPKSQGSDGSQLGFEWPKISTASTHQLNN
jgi:hypothetical protein